MFKSKVKGKKITKGRIRKRIRKESNGSEKRPRVCVFKRSRELYLQRIEDEHGHVLAYATSLDKDFRAEHKNTKTLAASLALGEVMAKKLKEQKKERILFDRGIYPYHGRVKALAEGLRKGGLVF